MSYRQSSQVRIVLEPDLPAFVTRPFGEILEEARKRHDLYRSVPRFWEAHVDRHLAVNVSVEHQTGRKPPECSKSYANDNAGLDGDARHFYKAHPRIGPFVLNALYALVAIGYARMFAGAHSFVVAGTIAGLVASAGVAFIVTLQRLLPGSGSGSVPRERHWHWFHMHALWPLALLWTFKEACAWVLSGSGWQRPPFDLLAEIKRVRQDPAGREYLAWARSRLEELSALAASSEAFEPIRTNVRTAIDRIGGLEQRYFFNVEMDRVPAERAPAPVLLQAEEDMRAQLRREYGRLRAQLAEAEAWISAAAQLDDIAPDAAPGHRRKRGA